jgi:hypothetical protein
MRKKPGINWNDNLSDFKSSLADAAKFVGNAIKSDLDSQAATFTNPWINLAGKAMGKNPNLREAGPKEAAINTAMAIASIATGGMAKSASTAMRAGKGTSRAVGASQAATSSLEGLAHHRSVIDQGEEWIGKLVKKGVKYGDHPAGIAKRREIVQAIQDIQLQQLSREGKIAREANRIKYLTRGDIFGE